MGKNNLCPNPVPLKLAVVLGDLKFGGSERQALHLSRLLDKSKFHVEVWLMAADDELASLASEWQIPLIWLSTRRGVGPTGVVNLARQLRKTPPDMLMLFTHLPNIWGCLWGRLNKIPLIVGSCRDGVPRWRHERWLWPLTDHLISNCASVKDRLTNNYRVPQEHITVIPNGVDTEYFRPTASRKRPPVVLSVGRLVQVKAHDILIKAFAMVYPKHPQAELWIVGDGPRLGELKKLARQILPHGKIKFLPPCIDIYPMYQKAGLLALSSLKEAMPNVVLEAMACGLPVVASAVGGIPEVVTHGRTGWLVPPGNSAVLADILDNMLADPQHNASLGQAGRKRVEKDFSFTSMVQAHEKIFERLAPMQGVGGFLSRKPTRKVT